MNTGKSTVSLNAHGSSRVCRKAMRQFVGSSAVSLSGADHVVDNALLGRGCDPATTSERDRDY